MQKMGSIVRGVGFAFGVSCLAAPPVRAAQEVWGPVVLQARVVDRAGNPVAGQRVRFDATLSGVARDGSDAGFTATRPVADAVHPVATTDANGIATATLTPHQSPLSRGWFHGSVRYKAHAVATQGRDTAAAGPVFVQGSFSVPATPTALNDDIPTLTVWEGPDSVVDGFPIWGKQTNRIVVLVEGFDLYNNYSATDTLRLVGGAGDALRRAGIALMVVNFPDSHQTPEQLAPAVARAIQAASRAANGNPVVVAGLSAGGITARWAMVTAENANVPLPVHTLVLLDTPNRGARFSPFLQAMVLRYGKKADRDALSSEAARVLLNETVTDTGKQVQWRRVGPPLAQRAIPTRIRPTSEAHLAFYTRLQQLNDRDGYPKCRLVAVANSSRGGKTPETATLMHLWLPWNSGWTLRAEMPDLAPGSRLPRLYVDQFKVSYPLGLAGAYLPTIPTFLPAASALDAGPGETPRFDAWYACPVGSTPLDHDTIDPGAAAFVVREILKSPWVR